MDHGISGPEVIVPDDSRRYNCFLDNGAPDIAQHNCTIDNYKTKKRYRMLFFYSFLAILSFPNKPKNWSTVLLQSYSGKW